MDADIAIIGGGIAGASAAWALSPYAKVVVLEAEDGLGFHSTGRSAAMLTETYAGSLVRKVTHASRNVLETEFATVDGLLRDRGVLWVASTGKEGVLDELIRSAADGPGTYQEIGALAICAPFVAREGGRVCRRAL